MIKIEKEKRYVKLSVIGYQYPEIENGYYDSNWLQVMLKADDGTNKWVKVDPALMTTDLIKCAAWFRDLSEGRMPENEILGFIEPCIAFAYACEDSGIILYIRFAYEMSPFHEINDEAYYIKFKLSRAELACVSDQFENESKCFPPR